jgi:hypothetical protein
MSEKYITKTGWGDSAGSVLGFCNDEFVIVQLSHLIVALRGAKNKHTDASI